ncbi:MAG TPA: acetyl-CoA carboxylase biotin carboxyl carrier protein [Pyrinomonadaceae bacterium]|nr:acetyl-CoA carboxylase biotin carboxyl carrier protein [Pyrinomonadaceae bacterium]HRK50077.1 acetyl-CoA carboxylase biotin carboxyl carrier protein [Pyrinomonadaceae bacterium]
MSEITASAKAMEKEKSESGKPRGSVAKGKVPDASLNMDELRELAELVNEHGFTDFEFENENIRVRLSKMAAAPIVQQYQPISQPHAAPPAPSATSTEALAVEAESDLHTITSPIVGTFYRSPGPDKEPYVSEGSSVGPDSVVCIVEAMKLMNEIQAETSGVIAKIFVENGQPVEYGQPLFGVKK